MTRLRSLAVLAALVALVSLLEPARAAQSAKPTFDFSPLEETVRQERQGPRTIRIVSRDGQVFLEQQARESPLLKLGDNELQSTTGLRIVVVRSASGTVEYLHMGGRSWRKMS